MGHLEAAAAAAGLAALVTGPLLAAVVAVNAPRFHTQPPMPWGLMVGLVRGLRGQAR